MDIEQIKDIILRGENQEIEFKESFHSTQTISKIICALANTLGGVLFFGVDDKGSIIGIKENPDKLQQKIANSNQAVSPIPLISVEIHEIDQKNIIAIVIQRAPDGTYYTFQGAIYVKIGSTIKRLEGQTQLNFLKNRQILTFDESYDSLMKIDDLDKIKIQNYLDVRNQNNYFDTHTIKEFLISNRLASENGDLKIKNPTVLLFGKNPNQFCPQAEIKLVQFSGNEPVKIIAHKLIQDDLINSIEQSIDFVKSHDESLIWTCTEEDDIIHISSGYINVNRNFHFVCEKPWRKIYFVEFDLRRESLPARSI